MFIGFYRSRTLRAFPRGTCYLRGSPKKIENTKIKKKQPRRNPGLRKHLTLGLKYRFRGVHGAAGCSLLHLNIFFGGMGKQGKSATLPVRMSADCFIRSNFVKT
jgi:hypothetical protein